MARVLWAKTALTGHGEERYRIVVLGICGRSAAA
jgi:hypothetical protein